MDEQLFDGIGRGVVEAQGQLRGSRGLQAGQIDTLSNGPLADSGIASAGVTQATLGHCPSTAPSFTIRLIILGHRRAQAIQK